MNALVLVHAEAWLTAACMDGDAATPVPLEGADEGAPCPQKGKLPNAVRDAWDAFERLHPNATLFIVADAPARTAWRRWLAENDLMLPEHWELRRFEALAPHLAGAPRKAWAMRLAPFLALDAEAEAIEAARARIAAAEAEEQGRWQAERSALLAEVERLRAERDALRRHDLERLATYLPALYAHFFQQVAPSDLALLCGHLTPPPLPNPYPEPSSETLRRLQRDFCHLPIATQREILAFAQRLPQYPSLVLRPEMCELVAALESEAHP